MCIWNVDKEVGNTEKRNPCRCDCCENSCFSACPCKAAQFLYQTPKTIAVRHRKISCTCPTTSGILNSMEEFPFLSQRLRTETTTSFQIKLMNGGHHFDDIGGANGRRNRQQRYNYVSEMSRVPPLPPDQFHSFIASIGHLTRPTPQPRRR